MRIGNRLFPYPVLNRNLVLTDYPEDNYFQLVFEMDDSGAPYFDDNLIIFKNVHFDILCPPLEKLIKDGLTLGLLVVECSSSVYRQTFPIDLIPQDIEISIESLKGEVSLTCILCASIEIKNCRGLGMRDIYEGMAFDFDKYDILAVDESVKFKVQQDDTKDNSVSSIFSIVKLNDPEATGMKCESQDNKILISLPPNEYAAYDNIKMRADFNSLSFATIAIPALIYCLDEIKKDIDPEEADIDGIAYGIPWLKSVQMRYEQVMGTSLTIDEFCNGSSLELAQIVMNDASCKSLLMFNELVIKGYTETNEDTEEHND